MTNIGLTSGISLIGQVIPLSFTNAFLLPSGQAVLQGAAEPGANVIIEATQDFVQWTVTGSTPAEPAGHSQFTVLDAPTLAHRFYRGWSQ